MTPALGGRADRGMSALIAAGAGSQVGRFRSMKYVVVRPEPTGFWLDPRGYLAELASLSAVLPPWCVRHCPVSWPL